MRKHGRQKTGRSVWRRQIGGEVVLLGDRFERLVANLSARLRVFRPGRTKRCIHQGPPFPLENESILSAPGAREKRARTSSVGAVGRGGLSPRPHLAVRGEATFPFRKPSLDKRERFTVDRAHTCAETFPGRICGKLPKRLWKSCGKRDSRESRARWCPNPLFLSRKSQRWR